ncbi:MAG: biopolymer transporter ExbD [Chitinophagaceae bacterium]|nr:MAG: biopolymer transporter ExbD [Chitinophagaceae bacterium]
MPQAVDWFHQIVVEAVLAFMESVFAGVLFQTSFMAEINQPAPAAKPGFGNGKKLSTRVDLTPMVDLGFILITFFVFTATLSEPSAMTLVMPADGGEPIPVRDSRTLTVIPAGNNQVFFYHSILREAVVNGRVGMVSGAEIGDLIREKQAYLDVLQSGSKKDLMLIIKPTAGASYRNVVDVLDEVAINEVKHYAMSDLYPEEEAVVSERRIRRSN